MAAGFGDGAIDNDAALLESFEKVRRDAGAEAQIFIDFAVGLENAGLYADSTVAVSEAIKRGVERADQFVQLAELYSAPLGRALLNDGDYVEVAGQALSLYRRALKLDPFNLDAIRGAVAAGLFVSEPAELDEIILLCKRWNGLTDDPVAEADQALVLILCHYLRGRRDEAADLIARALEKTACAPEILFMKGLIESSGDSEASEKTVQELRRLDRGLAEALISLSELPSVHYRQIACAFLTVQLPGS